MTATLELPPLRQGTQLTVVIPARDEEVTLPHALAALARQRALDGTALSHGVYDIVVLANGCRDATARVARAHADAGEGRCVSVIEVAFPQARAHIGTARRAIMDAVASRYLRAGMQRGIVASTDADTRVDERWIAATLDEMRHVDAVTGRIVLARDELARLDRSARALYLRDAAHRRLVGELEALYDPVAHDPLPRHGQHYGASFAVTAEAYARAGGIPPLPRLEDLAFYNSLERTDARVRHSMRVRVETSARPSARVDGGFGTFLSDLGARGTLTVESPALTIVDSTRVQRYADYGAAARARMTSDCSAPRMVVRRTFCANAPIAGNFLGRTERAWNVTPPCAGGAMRPSRWKPRCRRFARYERRRTPSVRRAGVWRRVRVDVNTFRDLARAPQTEAAR